MMNPVSMTSRATLAGLLLAVAASAVAQSVQHLSVTVPGGMPGLPTVTGIEQTTNGVMVTWDGPPGYYQLFQQLGIATPWQPVGGRTNLNRRAEVPADQAQSFFRVLGPSPQYAGSRACAECHPNVHENVAATAHTHALESLGSQATNPRCLPCHTVGFGLPTGYVIPGTTKHDTPHLAGVQCENCHGPAGNHAAIPEDLTVKPRVEIAAAVCGGCHSGSHQPTYEEWKTSGHAIVTEDMNPAGRISSCGRCHSGSVRLALLNGQPLPAGDANMNIACAVCHNPHEVTGNPGQLRNPVYSTNDFFLSTSDDFQAKYDPNINLCAQCHNHRGANWTSSTRPPHHSPQYNMLLGTVGQLASGQAPNSPAAHAFLEQQCVSCHMSTRAFTSDESPAITGHTFKVAAYESCQACHPLPELLVEFTVDAVTHQIARVKEALDSWALTKAPAALRTKYGTRAWEYTNPGSLSSGGPGPNSTEQGQIPDHIKKARFNLYIVAYDGSYGVHNGPFAITLLDTAMGFVQTELNR